jgi:tripartite-type tricarboxylate transporter receptor subunit TctC
MPAPPLAAVFAALLTAAPFASASAQDWPARPVKIIVGFAPGSSADQLARLVGQGLSTAFKQQFYVEYRQGNSGSLAANLVTPSAPRRTAIR